LKCRLPNSRLLRTHQKRREDEHAEQPREPWEARRSERLPVTQAGARPWALPSVPCVVEESNVRRTKSPSSRRRRRQVHKCNIKPIKPKPNTTRKWIHSSVDFRPAWMRVGIRSNRFSNDGDAFATFASTAPNLTAI